MLDGPSPGGSTPDSNDTEHSMLWSLVDWVQKDRKPSTIIGTKFKNDTADDGVAFTRPICQWPEIAEYGGGAMNEAGSWQCYR